jgi:hypothetical protein
MGPAPPAGLESNSKRRKAKTRRRGSISCDSKRQGKECGAKSWWSGQRHQMTSKISNFSGRRRTRCEASLPGNAPMCAPDRIPQKLARGAPGKHRGDETQIQCSFHGLWFCQVWLDPRSSTPWLNHTKNNETHACFFLRAGVSRGFGLGVLDFATN